MFVLLQAAIAGGCTPTTLKELTTIEAPAIVVVGTRHGIQPDISRSTRLVNKLRATGAKVTVGLQLLPTDRQSTLDTYAGGTIPTDDLRGRLEWDALGFDYLPYQKLLTGALNGTDVLALGHELVLPPDGTIVPKPPGYLPVLSDAMSGHLMAPELEPGFVRSVTWIDHRVAQDAVRNWSGEGYLVVVADRLHVEGGKGISWQMEQLTQVPVSTVLMGDEGRCYGADSVW